MYHRVCDLPEFDQLTVSPDNFEQQISALSDRHTILSLEQASQQLRAGGRLKSNSVVVTFDDGYLDNLTYALPILERYNVPAAIFITTDFAAQAASHPRYSKESSAGRIHLDWQQLRDLAEHPLITIGSHTVSHPYLQSVDDQSSSEEILKSAEIIEHELGMPVHHFCYPSGDYGNRELTTIGDSRYRSAVTVAPGVNRPADGTPYELKRSEVTDKDSPLMFRCKLVGAFDVVHGFLHQRRKKLFLEQAESQNSSRSQV